MERQCEAEGCTRRAVLGVQLIKANDEAQHATRWSCIADLPALFRTMAASVETAVTLEAIKRLIR